MMTWKKGKRKVRGSDGKVYDSKKQADNAYQAHESRAGTAARRTKWRAAGAAAAVWGLFMQVLQALLVLPKFTYYALRNGLAKIFHPTELADDVSNIPRDLLILPEFLCAWAGAVFRSVAKVFSPSTWRGTSGKYGRRSDEGGRR